MFGRAPQLLDLGERGAVVAVGADRADIHGSGLTRFATKQAGPGSSPG